MSSAWRRAGPCRKSNPSQYSVFGSKVQARIKNMKREEPEPIVRADLRKVFAAAPKAKAQWSDLTPLARKDFIMWIDSAKQSETRKRRIESIPGRLASGKRRPCCFAIVPINLHKALAGAPKAKVQWSKLTSLERRDFASWVDSAKDSETRRQRVEKICFMLAAGKRRP
jgi:uncharacterized protein YdeI (YjbR/CyaY-like superfamily)